MVKLMYMISKLPIKKFSFYWNIYANKTKEGSHMKSLTKEIDFADLKNNFDKICDDVNNNENLTLTLGNGRKVFIMSEKNYDNISRFIITNTQTLKIK